MNLPHYKIGVWINMALFVSCFLGFGEEWIAFAASGIVAILLWQLPWSRK